MIGTYSSDESINLTVNDHPNASTIYPKNGTVLHGIEILNASASSDDINISRFVFELDNNAAFTSPSLLCDSNLSNCTFNTFLQQQCANESDNCFLRVNVTDTESLVNSTIRTVNIDNLPPRVSLDSPANSTNTSSASITFLYNFTDQHPSSCTLYHNESGVFESNETNVSVVSGLQDEFIISLQDGIFVWNVGCNDSETNQGFNSTNYTLKVDRSPPITTLQNPVNNSFSIENVTFTYSTTDVLSGVANCTLVVNNRENQTDITITESTTQSFTVNNLTDGDYNWSVNCTDTLDNTNSSITRAVIIDNTGPVVTIDQPNNLTNLSLSTFRVNATVVDTSIGPNTTIFEFRENDQSSWQEICRDDDLNGGYNCTWDTSSLTEGRFYQVRARANDSLGTFGQFDTRFNITIDRTPPPQSLY